MRILSFRVILTCLLMVPALVRAQSISVDGLRGVTGVIITVATNESVREMGYSDAQILADVERAIRNSGIAVGDSLTSHPGFVRLRFSTTVTMPEMGNSQGTSISTTLSVRPLALASGATGARNAAWSHYAIRTHYGQTNQESVRSAVSDMLVKFAQSYHTANPRR